MKQSEHQQWLVTVIVINNLIINNNNKLWQRRQLHTEYLEKVKCVLLYFVILMFLHKTNIKDLVSTLTLHLSSFLL